MNGTQEYLHLICDHVECSKLDNPQNLLNFSYATSSAGRLSLNAALVKPLLLQGVHTIATWIPVFARSNRKLHWLRYIMSCVKRVLDILANTSECLDPLNSIMDSYCETVRCIMLSGTEENIYGYSTRHGDINIFMKSFIDMLDIHLRRVVQTN